MNFIIILVLQIVYHCISYFESNKLMFEIAV